jgi:hypothetical protein
MNAQKLQSFQDKQPYNHTLNRYRFQDFLTK